MALVRRILGDAQAKLRKMVDDGASRAEPEPADPLITPARADLSPPPGPPLGPPPGLPLGLPPAQPLGPSSEPFSLNGDRRNGKLENPFIVSDDEIQDTARWSAHNGSDSGTYAEVSPAKPPEMSPVLLRGASPAPPAGDSSDEERDPSPRSSGTDAPRIDRDTESVRSGGAAAAARRLRHENERLQAELTRVRRLLVAAAERGAANASAGQGDEGGELAVAREAVIALKADKKRLKAEKFELLSEMKQLYATLEDKERELREFIRNYEQMRGSGGASSSERGDRERDKERERERERERAALLRHARDEAERSLQLAAALNARDTQLRHATQQLHEARRLLAAAGVEGEALLGGSCSADSGVRVTGSSDGATSVCGGNLSDSPDDAVSLVSSQHFYQLGESLSPRASPFSRSVDLSRSVEQLSSPGESETALVGGSRRRGGAWGSISRVFARSRHRAKFGGGGGGGSSSGHESEPVYGAVGARDEAALREAAALPVSRWRAAAVAAWLEHALGMPQYAAAVAQNVKSGKVLLELSDAELEQLGVSAPLHRKKLRLAIEERRRPDLMRYPLAAALSHAWVAAHFLTDLGLPQYAESFLANLVDARMLDSISKKELEKQLGVTRKFHQASLVHGVHLLRIVQYDVAALARRRALSERTHSDPLVWTNQRFVRWARDIDLAEFAENLRESGVHGALAVLEPSFSGETLATALGIPPARTALRRHLQAEFDALVLPARSTFGEQLRALGRGWSASVCGGLPAVSCDASRRHSLRVGTLNLPGSITRALGVLKPRVPTPARALSSLSMQRAGGGGEVYVHVGAEEPIYAPLSVRSDSLRDIEEDVVSTVALHHRSVSPSPQSLPLPPPPRRVRSIPHLPPSNTSV